MTRKYVVTLEDTLQGWQEAEPLDCGNEELEKLIKENKEKGTKVMKDLNTGITIAFISMVLRIGGIIAVLCLLFFDMNPVFRINCEIILFVYFGVLLVLAIIDFVRILKIRHRVMAINKIVKHFDDFMVLEKESEG